jgi:hypothetical protein
MQQGVDVRASADAFGGGVARGMDAVGQGMQSIGQGMGQAAEAVSQLRDFEDRMKSKDALTGFERDLMEIQYGQNGYLTTQGRDAVDRREGYNAQIEELRKKYGSTLKGGAARYFDDAATSAVTSAMRTGIVHSAQGQKDWAASTSTARLALFQDQALKTYGDPKAVDKSIAAGFMEIDAQADLMGWGQDVVTLKRQEFATGVYSSVALALASETGGATKALEYLAGKSDLIDTATRMELETKLRPYANDEAAMAVVDEVLGMTRDTGAGAAEGTVGAAGPTAVRQRLYGRAAAAGKGRDHVDGLNEGFATNLLAMFEDAPFPGLQIGSGYRSEERQAEIIAQNMAAYGLGGRIAEWNADVAAMGPVAAGRKWRSTFQGVTNSAGRTFTQMVGMPGGSNHQHGNAVDIWYNGVRLEKAPAEVRQWVHDNAAAYGMRFPMSWESWHIEPSNARGGGAGSTAVPAMDGVSYRASAVSFEAAMARVNEIQDPEVRAAAMKQLNAQFEMRGKAEAARGQAAKSDIWSMVAQGVPMSQIPLDLKIAAGREAVQGFMDYEAKAGEITTDPVLQRDLTLYAATNPVEFARVDLTAPEVINNLSKTDLKTLIDKQALVLSDERKAREEGIDVSQAMTWAKTQLEAVGITTAGLTGGGNATKRQEMAAREAQFQLALADEMRAWKEANPTKRPSQMDIMQMTNKLLMPVVLNVPGSGWTSDETEGFLFDTINAPSNATADIVVEINDIPRDLRDAIRRDMTLERGGLPVSDEEVVQRYEDLQMGRNVPGPVNPAAIGNVTTTNLTILDQLRGFVDQVDPPQQ